VSLGIAQAIVGLFEGYALLGILFAVIFLSRGITDVDPKTASAPKSLRFLILPGVVAFWPLFARRWLAGAGEPVERNPHRDKAVSMSPPIRSAELLR
jgi:hypothetical protein